jgi:hypothetical protein
MIAYLKETGQRLSTDYGVVAEWLPMGDYKVILRNTIQDLALEDPWDGGETEVTVRSTRVNSRLTQLGYTEWAPLNHGGVEWEVRDFEYVTRAFKCALVLRERPCHKIGLYFQASFLGYHTVLPLAPLSVVMPQALNWAREITRDLYRHVESVTFNPKPKPNWKRGTSRFDIIEEVNARLEE